MMPILVRSDDVRSGRKAKARHGRLRPAWESIGEYSMMDFWFSFVANITERNLFGLDLVVLFELELVSYCFEWKPF